MWSVNYISIKLGTKIKTRVFKQLLTWGQPSCGTETSKCAWETGFLGDEGWPGRLPSPSVPCYRPWRCSETRSTSDLCRHPVGSTWARHGWCWLAPAWWKRRVLKGTTNRLPTVSSSMLFLMTQPFPLSYDSQKKVETEKTGQNWICVLLCRNRVARAKVVLSLCLPLTLLRRTPAKWPQNLMVLA